MRIIISFVEYNLNVSLFFKCKLRPTCYIILSPSYEQYEHKSIPLFYLHFTFISAETLYTLFAIYYIYILNVFFLYFLKSGAHF